MEFDMRDIRPDVLRVVADVLLNLAAAWFGASVVTAPFFDFSAAAAVLLLLANILAGILSLSVAIVLRRLADERSYI